jgi:ATP-dependent helicase Lhr and Lhr-like helicase
MLVRHTRFLSEVRAVLLDELHILDGTTRGDQLRILLERLRRVTRRGWGGDPQVAVTSATIGVPAAMGARYLRDPVEILVPSAPQIETAFALCPRPGDVVGAIDAAYGAKAAAGASKILVFTNRRNDVETFAAVAARLGLLGERVFAHHGSLSREERERVEERFLRAPSGVCFATMTLELGIDIGDVDLVVLVEPPTSVAGFLQRVGRGNRRTGRARVLCCCRDRGDRARFAHLLGCAERGDLLPSPYVFRPSVVGQQVCSLLMQSRAGFISSRVVWERLPPDQQAVWSLEVLDELMERLCATDWLVPGRRGGFAPGEKLARGHRLGTMHANLPQEADGLEVVDEDTGQVLGQVAAAERGVPLTFAGRSRRVLREVEGRLYVQSSSEDAGEALFSPRGRHVLTWETARSLQAALGVAADALPYVDLPAGYALFHFAGSLAGELLARHLKDGYGWPVARGSALALVFEEPLGGDELPELKPADLATAMGRMGRKLSRLAGAGPFDGAVPARIQKRFLESIVNVDRLAALWNGARIQRNVRGTRLQTLVALAKVW